MSGDQVGRQSPGAHHQQGAAVRSGQEPRAEGGIGRGLAVGEFRAIHDRQRPPIAPVEQCIHRLHRGDGGDGRVIGEDGHQLHSQGLSRLPGGKAHEHLLRSGWRIDHPPDMGGLIEMAPIQMVDQLPVGRQPCHCGSVKTGDEAHRPAGGQELERPVMREGCPRGFGTPKSLNKPSGGGPRQKRGN